MVWGSLLVALLSYLYVVRCIRLIAIRQGRHPMFWAFVAFFSGPFIVVVFIALCVLRFFPPTHTHNMQHIIDCDDPAVLARPEWLVMMGFDGKTRRH